MAFEEEEVRGIRFKCPISRVTGHVFFRPIHLYGKRVYHPLERISIRIANVLE